MSNSSKYSHSTAPRSVGLPRGSRGKTRPLISILSDWEDSVHNAGHRLMSFFSLSTKNTPLDYAADCPDKLEPPPETLLEPPLKTGVYDFSSGRKLDV